MLGWAATRLLPLVPKRIVRSIAWRYVAGTQLEDAVRTVRLLNGRGYEATIDVLGENARNLHEADETVSEYLNVLDVIKNESLLSNISVKLTHLGLRLGAEEARKRLESIVLRGRDFGTFVRIDMEDSSVTDVTFEVYRQVLERVSPLQGARHCDPVGVVLQAYLRRTRRDAEILAERGANVRICKGIYREPRAIAYHDKEEVRVSFMDVARTLLLAPKTYVAFATHDRVLVERCLTLVEELNVSPERFEFQVLLGVPVETMLDMLVRRGLRVRVYVPYGEDWYPYATRRLKENPKIASYVLRHLFTRDRGPSK